ncbi:SulP family inorganic anion transporter [Hydrogenophilus thermoluteolus]|uniref:SulP family inorganic anion transporter n=1 Tax=Hydrogenophilus thermoluteolus TaxID=297 RepID=UPI003F67B6B9
MWADLTAGVTVGALALPLSMAFAIASGTPPLNGVWTAVIAGVSYGLLGGSRVLVAGPASAFIPLLFAIVSQFGPSALLAATWFAGLILLLLGLFRLGNLVRLIPNSVITGFINGIAVIIILTQVKDFLGLALAVPPSGLVGKLRAVYDALPTLQPASAALGFGSLALLLGWTRLERRIPKLRRLPAPLVTLVAGTAIVWGANSRSQRSVAVSAQSRARCLRSRSPWSIGLNLRNSYRQRSPSRCSAPPKAW